EDCHGRCERARSGERRVLPLRDEVPGGQHGERRAGYRSGERFAAVSAGACVLAKQLICREEDEADAERRSHRRRRPVWDEAVRERCGGQADRRDEDRGAARVRRSDRAQPADRDTDLTESDHDRKHWRGDECTYAGDDGEAGRAESSLARRRGRFVGRRDGAASFFGGGREFGRRFTWRVLRYRGFGERFEFAFKIRGVYRDGRILILTIVIGFTVIRLRLVIRLLIGRVPVRRVLIRWVLIPVMSLSGVLIRRVLVGRVLLTLRLVPHLRVPAEAGLFPLCVVVRRLGLRKGRLRFLRGSATPTASFRGRLLARAFVAFLALVLVAVTHGGSAHPPANGGRISTTAPGSRRTDSGSRLPTCCPSTRKEQRWSTLASRSPAAPRSATAAERAAPSVSARVCSSEVPAASRAAAQ